MEDTKEITIYALADPRTNEVRYVGKATNISNRLSNHKTLSSKRTDFKSRWIAKLKAEGLAPKLIVLEKVLGAEWLGAEYKWIQYYLSEGDRLLNFQNVPIGYPATRSVD